VQRAVVSRCQAFTKLSHHVTVAFVWWCLAGALNVLSAVLFQRVVAMLSAANPNARLPWIGLPANRPGRAIALQYLAIVIGIFAMYCVVAALNRRHPYDAFWDLPFALLIVVATVVPQARHNRRVQRAA
jgi:hypothetical protein